jgi:hypothetical protein
MMISTNSTSIIGVTLIWAFCPLPPMFMLMVDWTAGRVRKFPVEVDGARGANVDWTHGDVAGVP